LARFQNSITYCLTKCDRCTGAYTDDRNIILLNCCCDCHKNDGNKELGVMNKHIESNHGLLSEDLGLSSLAKDGV